MAVLEKIQFKTEIKFYLDAYQFLNKRLNNPT